MAVILNDDDLRDAIVDAYAGERFTMPLSEVQQPRGRRPMWISMAAVATAAAVVLGFVLVNGASRDDTLPIGPAASVHPRPDARPDLMPILKEAEVEADCRSAGLSALRADPGIPPTAKDKLPPLRVGSVQNFVGGAFVFADERVLVECVRYGVHEMDVSVRDISDGSAPWLGADGLPYETHTDADIGRMLVVGWAPAGATHVYVGGPRGSSEGFILRFPADPASSSAASFFLTSVPMVDPADLAGFVVVVSLPDRTITRYGGQPATSMPR